ncbi:hypothetical protein ABW22_08360 [Thiobacillus denitrificans]|uniref:Transmembrane protein n=2 Tax=Thiobacillus denitrificans TaxID=36861 RepID=A0A119CW32_THIDE|nr:hypothetical protein ABW22_08360 [Thiobacillus denitrificans]
MDVRPVEVEAEPGAAADTAEPQVGRFERLKQFFSRGHKPVPEQPVEPDQAALGEAPAREQADASAIEEEASAPQRSLLARLKTTFRQQPKPEVLEADESIPGAGRNRDATAFSEDDSDSDEDTVQPGRIRRVLAMLSNKWVWIPGASAMLLVLIGAMALMLLQSAQEKEHLQAKLLAMQKKLEQTGVAKERAADAPAPVPADAPAFSAVGSAVADRRPGIDAGDCQVSDKASVTQNLKNCIDSFNRSMAGSR